MRSTQSSTSPKVKVTAVMNMRWDRLRHNPGEQLQRTRRSNAMTSLELYLDNTNPSELCWRRESLALEKQSLCRSSSWTGLKGKTIRTSTSYFLFLSESLIWYKIKNWVFRPSSRVFHRNKRTGYSSSEYKVLFIFDGLDECRLSLDSHSDVRLCDVTESATVDVLLINLILGNLLPSALIWITSRPAAADLVPSACVHRVTEVRGFNEPQKEEYFRKRISDQSLANRIISHLKSSRSLYIMCHIPVFCWISAAVLEKMMSRAERRDSQDSHSNVHTLPDPSDQHQTWDRTMRRQWKMETWFSNWGNWLSSSLWKANLIFYEEDWERWYWCDRSISVLRIVHSDLQRGVWLLSRESVLLCSSEHQEHLAALYGPRVIHKWQHKCVDLINKERLWSKMCNLMHIIHHNQTFDIKSSSESCGQDIA